VARHQKTWKSAPLARKGSKTLIPHKKFIKAPGVWHGAEIMESALGHEGPQDVASTQEIYQETSGAWQGTTNMEKVALATKGPKMSLPHRKFIKKPGGRGKAAKRWKSAPGHKRAH
jgi:hypothetical protein